MIQEISPMHRFDTTTMTHLVLGLALLMPVTALPAQPTQLPFRSLDIGLQLAANTNREELHNYWKSYPALGGMVETPFYAGIARAGVQIHPFAAKSADAFDFTDTFIYIGWGLPFVQTTRVAWVNTLALGAHIMLFTNPESENNKETEMGVGFATQIKYRFRSPWSISLACSYNRMFTWKRINLAYISCSLSYLVDTPEWLRGILE
jgi:hypothetical protein